MEIRRTLHRIYRNRVSAITFQFDTVFFSNAPHLDSWRIAGHLQVFRRSGARLANLVSRNSHLGPGRFSINFYSAKVSRHISEKKSCRFVKSGMPKRNRHVSFLIVPQNRAVVIKIYTLYTCVRLCKITIDTNVPFRICASR